MPKAAAAVVAMVLLVSEVQAQTFGGGASIGVSVRELAADEVTRATFDRPGGVYVVDVEDDGPASRAGVRSGDILVSFDGERIRGVRHFSRLVAETPPGRAVSSEIVRDGARRSLMVAPEPTEGIAGFMPELRREIERGLRTLPPDLPMAQGPRGARTRLGVALAPLSDQLAAYFGVKHGVLVSAVEAESPAARAGIRAGDVLTAIDGRAVESPADVSAVVRAAARGATFDLRLTRDRKEMTVKVMLPDGATAREVRGVRL